MQSQLTTRRQIGEAAYAHACDTMSRFARYLELPEVVVVHGFFEPGRVFACPWNTFNSQLGLHPTGLYNQDH